MSNFLNSHPHGTHGTPVGAPMRNIDTGTHALLTATQYALATHRTPRATHRTVSLNAHTQAHACGRAHRSAHETSPLPQVVEFQNLWRCLLGSSRTVAWLLGYGLNCYKGDKETMWPLHRDCAIPRRQSILTSSRCHARGCAILVRESVRSRSHRQWTRGRLC